MIVPIGAWVIDEACRKRARWRDDDLMEVKVPTNVSAMRLRRSHIVGTLHENLDTHSTAPEMLELEITEIVLMDGAENYLEAINALRELGVELSLDDFGTGYSGLNYLNRFRLNRLKIDRAFVP
ncbi:MAG: EAL domain-containing protein [Janthinobacterium lividum]